MTELHLAAAFGSAENCTQILAQGTPVDIFESLWGTPLCAASALGKVDNVKLLLQQGADVNGKNGQGLTALCLAVAAGHVDVVDVLLKNKAEPELEDEAGCTALAYVLDGHQMAAARLLLSAHADANHKPADGWTPLHLAISRGNLEMVQLLLDNGGDITGEGPESSLPLYTAVATKSLPMIELLLANGAQINAPGSSSVPPIFFAILSNNENSVRLLLEKGAKVTWDKSGSTIFHAAVQWEFSSVRMLIEYISRQGPGRVVELINQRNNKGQTPLHYATRQGNLEMVQALVEFGANIEVEDNSSMTPLLLADIQEKTDVKDFLLSRGAKATWRWITLDIVLEDETEIQFRKTVRPDQEYKSLGDQEIAEFKDSLEERFEFPSPISRIKLADTQDSDPFSPVLDGENPGSS